MSKNVIMAITQECVVKKQQHLELSRSKLEKEERKRKSTSSDDELVLLFLDKKRKNWDCGSSDSQQEASAGTSWKLLYIFQSTSEEAEK